MWRFPRLFPFFQALYNLFEFSEALDHGFQLHKSNAGAGHGTVSSPWYHTVNPRLLTDQVGRRVLLLFTGLAYVRACSRGPGTACPRACAMESNKAAALPAMLLAYCCVSRFACRQIRMMVQSYFLQEMTHARIVGFKVRSGQ
jgi:hypothetical protein